MNTEEHALREAMVAALRRLDALEIGRAHV